MPRSSRRTWAFAQLIEQAMLTTDGAAAGLVTAHLERMRLAGGYADIAVFDVAGKPLLALRKFRAPTQRVYQLMRMRAQRQRAIVRRPLSRCVGARAWICPAAVCRQDGRCRRCRRGARSAPEHFLSPDPGLADRERERRIAAGAARWRRRAFLNQLRVGLAWRADAAQGSGQRRYRLRLSHPCQRRYR